MSPTPEGALLAASLSDGFATLAQGCRRLSDLRSNRPLAIACTLSFAENWLMPRIGAFWAAHPDIALSIRPGNEVVDLKRDGIDLAIRYGRGSWPGLRAQAFLTGDFIFYSAPQCAPITPARRPEDLMDHCWLLDSGRAEQGILARDFGICFDTGTMRTFETNGMVLAATRAGLGIALQSRAVIARDLEAGTLVELLPVNRTNLGYWLVTQPGVLSPSLRTVMRWLTS